MLIYWMQNLAPRTSSLIFVDPDAGTLILDEEGDEIKIDPEAGTLLLP